jgi:Flp pilus assembly protein TadD
MPVCTHGSKDLSSYRAFGAVIALLICSATCAHSIASASNRTEDQVCDPLGDYYLGMEDYPAAISRHLVIVREHPENALAHYHLGFAYGMLGQHRHELVEYRRAVRLGLDDWQVFVNLGLAYLEDDQIQSATEVLQLAALLGPYQPQAHFNLGLSYERCGRLSDAEREMLLSLRLNPDEPDARNTLGLIYAEEGRYALAREEWNDLLTADPAYTPARQNLTILERAEHAASGTGVAVFARTR